MKKNLFALSGIIAMLALVLVPFTVSAGSVEIGSKIENFKLTDLEGKERSLNDLKGKNGAVLIFVSAQCPVVKAYHERMNQLTADLAEKGINVIGINSNATEDLNWVKTDAAENYKFVTLIDKGNVIADKLGATVTPEVYYVGGDNTLLYHGAIDNDRSGKNITDEYLKLAYEAVGSKKAVERTTTKAFGCSIKRTDAPAK